MSDRLQAIERSYRERCQTRLTGRDVLAEELWDQWVYDEELFYVYWGNMAMTEEGALEERQGMWGY